MFGLLVKILVFYLIIRIGFSIFSSKNRISKGTQNNKKKSEKRYQSGGDSIEEADFEEVK